MSLAGFDVTRFIAFASGTSRVTPNIAMTLLTRGAGAVDRHPRADVDLGAGQDVAHAHAGDPFASFRARHGLGVIHQAGAARLRPFGERDRQPVGVDDLVVVPVGAAGQPVRAGRRQTASAWPRAR